MEPLQEVGMGLSSSSGPSGRNLYDCMLRLRLRLSWYKRGMLLFMILIYTIEYIFQPL